VDVANLRLAWPRAFNVNPDKLIVVGLQESDSHYGMKYPHKQSEQIIKPKKREIPGRIQAHIKTTCAWYYHFSNPPTNT
jgi:sulfotransferase